MSRMALLLIAGSLLCACYRTHYVNFSPQSPMKASAEASPEQEPARGAWRHFFIWGWVPNEMPIDARKTCGGAQNIESIQTQERFVQGLIAAFAGYYINVYSPYNGAIYCKQAVPAGGTPDGAKASSSGEVPEP